MTTLSLLNGDWEYQFEDETNDVAAVVGTRMLHYISGPVRTTREVYSALAEAIADFQGMGFKNPMLPVTPNEYTMENQAFIPRSSIEMLKEGTITADWTVTASPDTSGNGVYRVPYSGGTGPVPSDIGKRITQAGTGDTGTLLDYEIEPDGTTIAWIRPEDSTPTTGDAFDGTGALTVTNGTMSTTSSTAATNGNTRYNAFQAIGSVPTATEVYLIQNRIKLADADTNTFNWYSTDPTVSLGIVSTLVRVETAGATIQAGDLEVFARRYTALYDNFRLNINTGGFQALPLASSPDINNTTGYSNSGTLSSVSGSPTVGNAVYVGASWAAATAKGVITAVNGSTDFDYYLIGDLTAIGSTTGVTGYDFDTQANDGFSATTGTIGVVSGGPTDTTSGEGGTVTITIGHTTRDHDNSGVAEPYSIIVDAQSNVAIAKVYERIKYVCRRGQDNTFWDTVSCSIPGEQWRGIEALAYYSPNTGTMVEGEDLNNETQTAQTMRLIADNAAAAGEGVSQDYVTLADLQPSTITLADNDVLADTGSTDDVTVDTAGAGGAILTVSSPKSSPFGTFTGTQIFGAQGIDFRNPGAGDAQAYILTDDLGTLRSPPNTVSYTVANTRAGDKIFASRDNGTAGVIDKDRHGGSHATNNAVGDSDFQVAGSVDGQVPQASVIRVVETALEQEHRYYYSSRTTGAGGVFTFRSDTSYTGTATAGTSDTVLEDTGQTFQTHNVEVGMLVHVAGRSSTYEVTAVTDEDTLAIKLLYGAGGFVSTDTYTINKLIQTYDGNDDVFDTILDVYETTGTDGTPGTESNTFVKEAGTFGTVVQVRQGKVILPFEQNQDQGQGDTTVTTVRQPDTIAV